MSHLYKLRIGWEGERLAHYLLSRFSFVAQPTTIADDVGSDFYCTIFDIPDSNPPVVEPRTSFAIQVKSNTDKIEVHNKIQYLQNLEIPFFIGVVGQSAAELRIYSAERLPMLFATYGIPEKLWLRPIDDDKPQQYCQGESAKMGVTLDCYHVCSFNASEGRDQLRPKVTQLLNLCRRATANIGSRRAEEHIYQWDQDGTIFSIVAGCGSVDHFRDNMYKRLAEAFHNFKYMLDREPEKFSREEFDVYEAFYLALLASHKRPMLQLVNGIYPQVKSHCGTARRPTCRSLVGGSRCDRWTPLLHDVLKLVYRQHPERENGFRASKRARFIGRSSTGLHYGRIFATASFPSSTVASFNRPRRQGYVNPSLRSLPAANAPSETYVTELVYKMHSGQTHPDELSSKRRSTCDLRVASDSRGQPPRVFRVVLANTYRIAAFTHKLWRVQSTPFPARSMDSSIRSHWSARRYFGAHRRVGWIK